MTPTGIGANSRSADTKVDRPDELEARREERVPADAGYQDNAVLEWLPEPREDGAWELGRRPWDMQRFAVVGVGQSVGQSGPRRHQVASGGTWPPGGGRPADPLLPVRLRVMPPAGFEPALQP